MSQQQALHQKANAALDKLKGIVDELKELGPCRLDGDNAVENIRDKLNGLLARLPRRAA